MLRQVTHARDAFQYLHLLTFVHLCDRVFLMTEWVCRWKPLWIPIGDTCQKAYLEEWQLVDDGSKQDPGENSTKTVPCVSDSSMLWKTENKDGTVKHEQPLDASSAPKSPGLENLTHQLGSSPELRVLRPFGKNRRHHCLLLSECAILFTESNSVPFQNV